MKNILIGVPFVLLLLANVGSEVQAFASPDLRDFSKVAIRTRTNSRFTTVSRNTLKKVTEHGEQLVKNEEALRRARAQLRTDLEQEKNTNADLRKNLDGAKKTASEKESELRKNELDAEYRNLVSVCAEQMIRQLGISQSIEKRLSAITGEDQQLERANAMMSPSVQQFVEKTEKLVSDANYEFVTSAGTAAECLKYVEGSAKNETKKATGKLPSLFERYEITDITKSTTLKSIIAAEDYANVLTTITGIFNDAMKLITGVLSAMVGMDQTGDEDLFSELYSEAEQIGKVDAYARDVLQDALSHKGQSTSNPSPAVIAAAKPLTTWIKEKFEDLLAARLRAESEAHPEPLFGAAILRTPTAEPGSVTERPKDPDEEDLVDEFDNFLDKGSDDK